MPNIKASGYNNDSSYHKFWIAKKANEFGWDEEKHSQFDHNISQYRMGRSGKIVERIGKKYQWLAYREYLSNLMDNYLYKNSEDRHNSSIRPYLATMKDMLSFRTIGPTLLKTKVEEGWSLSCDNVYGRSQLNLDSVYQDVSYEEKKEWLEEEQDMICRKSSRFEIDENEEE